MHTFKLSSIKVLASMKSVEIAFYNALNKYKNLI